MFFQSVLFGVFFVFVFWVVLFCFVFETGPIFQQPLICHVADNDLELLILYRLGLPPPVLHVDGNEPRVLCRPGKHPIK